MVCRRRQPGVVQPQVGGPRGQHRGGLPAQVGGAGSERGHGGEGGGDPPSGRGSSGGAPHPRRRGRRRAGALQDDAVGAGRAEQHVRVVARVRAGRAGVGMGVHEQVLAGRSVPRGGQHAVQEGPSGIGAGGGDRPSQLAQFLSHRCRGPGGRAPLIGGVQRGPGLPGRRAGIDAGVPQRPGARRAEAGVQQPAGYSRRGAARLVMRAAVVEAVPAARLQLDLVHAVQRGDLGGQRDRVGGHLRGGDAQRPRVDVPVSVPDCAVRVGRGEAPVVRDHDPGVHPEPGRVQGVRGPLERSRRGLVQLRRAQERVPPAARIGPVVDRRVPGHDPLRRVEGGDGADRVVGGGQGHLGDAQSGDPLGGGRVPVHVPRVQVSRNRHRQSASRAGRSSAGTFWYATGISHRRMAAEPTEV